MKYTVNQLKHDLLFRVKLQPGEVDALLAHPELTGDDTAAVAARDTIDGIMRQSAEPAVLQASLQTFVGQLLRDGAVLVQPGPQSQPETSTEVADETIVSDLEVQPVVTESVVTEPAPMVDLELPPAETQV